MKYLFGVICGSILGFAVYDIVLNENIVLDPSGERSIVCQRMCKKHDMKVLAKDPAPLISCVCEKRVK